MGLSFGHLRNYVGEKVDWFDRIKRDTWSPIWFEDFVQQLGYEKNPSIEFYWLLPGKILADGLRLIASDHDTNVMALVVEMFKTFEVHVDHDDNMRGLGWDDIITIRLLTCPRLLTQRRLSMWIANLVSSCQCSIST